MSKPERYAAFSRWSHLLQLEVAQVQLRDKRRYRCIIVGQKRLYVASTANLGSVLTRQTAGEPWSDKLAGQFGVLMMELSREIWSAVKRGHIAVLASLLNGKVDPAVFRYEEKYLGWGLMTALAMAAHKGDTIMVEMLVHAGADVNYQDSELDRTALMLTSAMGHHATALALLQFGTRVNAQNRWKRSALIIAADFGYLETVHVLLEWGADKNLRQDQGGLRAVDLASNKDIKALINTHQYAAPQDPVLSVAAEVAAVEWVPAKVVTAEVAAAECAALEGECDTLGELVALAPACRSAILLRRALKAQLKAAEARNADLKHIGELGIALEELELEAAKLPLLEEDYFALAGMHTALMQRVEAKGREFVKAEFYRLVYRMGVRLDALREMDLSVLILPSVSDHMRAEPWNMVTTTVPTTTMETIINALAVKTNDPPSQKMGGAFAITTTVTIANTHAITTIATAPAIHESRTYDVNHMAHMMERVAGVEVVANHLPPWPARNTQDVEITHVSGALCW